MIDVLRGRQKGVHFCGGSDSATMPAMNTDPVKTRFAPSPTGWLHLGNARTALFSALYALKSAGVFLLRIEDTDRTRSEQRYTAALMEDLAWAGLRWQEGPGADEPHRPYLQSERDGIYRHYFDALEGDGRAYPCFCTERELELSRKAQLSAGRPPRYAGTCARLSPTQVAERRERGLPEALRFGIEEGHAVVFDDMVRGTQQFRTSDIGDFIIRRANGTPAFFFCNAIDDALMGVTHVLRGEDHLANTPRQILLLQTLNLPVPRYGHISMIVGADGAPLSKRTGSRSLRALREGGYLPGAVNNYLARLGHYYEDNRYMSLTELAAAFELSHLGRAPARYDEAQLLHWQREAVAHLDAETFWRWAGQQVHALVPAESRDAFIDAVRTNVTHPEHVAHWAKVLFGDELPSTHRADEVIGRAGAEFFDAAAQALEAFSGDTRAWLDAVKSATGAKGKNLFEPLRAALTGELDGPELGKLLPLLSVSRAQSRLAAHAGR